MRSNLIKSALLSLFFISSVELIGYNIGDVAEGGVIFWLKPDQSHGLAVSIVDMQSSTTLPWAPLFPFAPVAIGATGNGLSFGTGYTTTGKINSELIVSASGPVSTYPLNSYAAGACAAYSYVESSTGITYTDWYLPNQVELGLLMSIMGVVNTVLTTTPVAGSIPIQSAPYWTSLENDANDAFFQDFSTALQSSEHKQNNSTCYVRAIRAF